MIIPVRCFTWQAGRLDLYYLIFTIWCGCICSGKVIGNKYETYCKMIMDGKEIK
jgi:DNA-directed RNA polymerase subunit N (RpoN/RPB10)